MCVCLSICSLLLMHTHSFEWICMWHPYTVQMVMGVGDLVSST